MRTIYHLVPRSVWEDNPNQPYRPESLEREGFIHCSFAEQVAASANRFYADAPELLLLHIDVDRLRSSLREEESGTGEIFPHIHGPLNRDAVASVETLDRGPEGRWQFMAS
ncbi:MAG TPA: DUF952 domain-containing protein [Gemmataceae bacterium]|nr:DUF952 domain-containing protein [Gemmataceae bacterium]